ncbi:MAG: hypothetical protein ACREAB_10380 [Blastocatellia bacterium]
MKRGEHSASCLDMLMIKIQTVCRKFTEYPISEAPGVVEITKWVGSHTLELVAKKDGKVVGESMYEVSKDGKTLTSKVKGTDAKGRQFEQVIVFDRE